MNFKFNKFLEKSINFFTFIGISFFVDIILSFLIKKLSLGKILVLHGTLYLIYGAILLLTYMVFDTARGYEKLHEKKHILPLPKEVSIKDIVFSILGGFLLITLEAFFH